MWGGGYNEDKPNFDDLKNSETSSLLAVKEKPNSTILKIPKFRSVRSYNAR